jgi:cytochrome c553
MQIILSCREKLVLNRPVWRVGITVFVALLTLLLCRVEVSLAELPTLAEKKSVVLDKDRTEAEHFFVVSCTKCHGTPNPIDSVLEKPKCWQGLSEADNSRVQTYIADVVNGKSQYESHCGRCHALISPSAHVREYWSKNVCTSQECFIQNLKPEEEQQVLLYLRSQAKKD